MARQRKAPKKSLVYEKTSKRLYKAILGLSVDQCTKLFEDLLSHKEVREVVKRFYIAELLARKVPQRQIEDMVRQSWGKASTTSIGRVKEALEGETNHGGLALVLKKTPTSPS